MEGGTIDVVVAKMEDVVCEVRGGGETGVMCGTKKVVAKLFVSLEEGNGEGINVKMVLRV